MNFTRGKVQILYSYLPGAIFAHDEFGHCRVTMIELNELPEINREAVAEVVSDTLAQWVQEWQHGAYPPAQSATDLERYFVIGEPTAVCFEPFPTSLRCQKCGRVFKLADLRRNPPGRCVAQGCGGSLEQMPFLQAHQCGRLEEIFVQRDGCSRHGVAGLYFDDTGRVTTARWRCRLCGGAEVARLRQTPCGCDFSRLGTQEPSEQRLRFLAVTDPAVFKPQILPFINFPKEEMSRLSTPDARPWVLARIWGLLDGAVHTALADTLAVENDETAAAIRALAEVVPNHPQVRAWEERNTARRAQSTIVERVRRLTGCSDAGSISVSRRHIEQASVLDSVSNTDVETAASRLESTGDTATAALLRETGLWTKERLGVEDIRALDGFPIGLAAVGYTRISADPTRTILNPFPQVSQRTPLYAVVASTEAIYIQLQPQRVVRWLQRMRLLDPGAADSSAEAWAKLYREVPGLASRKSDPPSGAPSAVAVRTLLHSMSHVLLRHIEWSGYAAQSVGEYLMPEGLAFVLYASRYTDTKVGGLLTLFEQGLRLWLEGALHEGGDCVMDPFCGEEGGACAGCLHREFNCTEFNRELSRSVLYGGPAGRHHTVFSARNIIGYWTPEWTPEAT